MSGWRQLPLRTIYRRIERSNRPELPLLSVYRDLGVVLREGRDDNYNKPSDDLSSYKLVEPGDVVLNKMKTWQGSIGVSTHRGIVSPAYFVGRRTVEADDRFMHHLLRSLPLIGEYRARSKGIRPAQWDLPWDEFADIKVRLPRAPEQRAIADFLDAETARIDALIAKRQAMIRLSQERQSALRHDHLHPRKGLMPIGWKVMSLGRTLRQLTNGYVGPTRDILVGDGIRYIQGMHIKGGSIAFERRSFFVTPEWHSSRPRIALQEGDVLIVQTGDIGQVAVVPPLFGAASCHALLIARPRRELLDSDFLAFYLRSPLGRQELLRLATGALHPHLEFGIRDARVIVPPLPEQQAIVRQLRSAEGHSAALLSCMTTQISLLRERRQALITAAVTGELSFPGTAA